MVHAIQACTQSAVIVFIHLLRVSVCLFPWAGRTVSIYVIPTAPGRRGGLERCGLGVASGRGALQLLRRRRGGSDERVPTPHGGGTGGKLVTFERKNQRGW